MTPRGLDAPRGPTAAHDLTAPRRHAAEAA